MALARRRVVVALVAVLASAVPARAQRAPLWGEVSLVGGTAAARELFSLGEDEGRLRAGWLVDFVRRSSRAGNWDDVVSRLARYQATLQLVRAAGLAEAQGVRAPAGSASRDDTNRFAHLVDALGLERVADRSGLRFEIARSREGHEHAVWMRAVGIDVEDVAAKWTAGEPVTFDVPITALPLPLPSFWAARARGAVPTLSDVVTERSPALLYAALLALDTETLQFLDAHQDVLGHVIADDAATFAAFASGVRVRDGAIDVPGGRATWPVWQSLAGVSPGDPQAFLPALLAADGSALARFVDAIAKAPTVTRASFSKAFASTPASLREVYRAFRDACGNLPVRVRPFDRPTADPAFALALIELRDPQLPGPVWLPTVLERAVDGGRWSTASKSPKPTDGNVEWLARWLFAVPDSAVSRARLLQFASRLTSLDTASPSDVEEALRTVIDLPALAQSLERLGIRDAALFAKVGRAAYQLTRTGPRGRAEPMVARWQTALAVLEHAARLNLLPAPSVRGLLEELAVAANPSPSATDAVVRWVTDRLLPALQPDTPPAPLTSQVLANAFRPASTGVTRVTWDGLAYARDPAAKARKDTEALLTARPAVVQLDSRMFETAGTPSSEFDALRASMRANRAASPLVDRLSRQMDEAARAMRRSGPGAGAASGRSLPEVDELLRQAADLALQPVVYALAMSPLHHAPALEAEAWTYHSLALPNADDNWWRVAWRLATPTIRPGGGRALVGSWLVIDLALGEAMVPRRFDQGGDLPEPVREALYAEAAVRAHAGAAWAAPTKTLVEGLARGRQWLAQSTPATLTPDGQERVDTMGSGTTRANLARWTLARAPAELAAGLTTLEVARLGSSALPGVPVVSLMLDDCACLRSTAMAADDWRAQWPRGLTVALSADLYLRVAELLDAARLPLSLVDDVVPLAMADWMARIEPYSGDDWEALTLWPRRLVPADVEGYVLQLIADGVLVAAEEESR